MKSLSRLLKFKKTLGIIMILAMLMALIVPVTAVFAATENATVSFSPSPINVSAGATFSVNLTISTDTPVFGWGLDVHYDASKLTYNGITEGTYLKNNGSTNPGTIDTSTPGVIAGIAYALTGDNIAPVTSNGQLATLSFTVNSGVNNIPTSLSIASLLVMDANTNPFDGATSTTGNVIIGVPPVQPVISGFTPTSGSAGQPVVITGSGFTGTTQVQFGSTNATSFTVNSDTQITAIVDSGTTGVITVINPLYSGTSTGTFTYTQTPTITTFTSSQYKGGSVVITGTGFIDTAANTAVSFGGVAATGVVVNSASQITATVGTGASGNVTVQTTYGTASKSGFTFIAASITGLTPTTAYTGDVVTITGVGFTGSTAVTFGGVAAGSFTVVSDTQINATVGNGASGSVAVTTPGSTITKTGFTYKQVTISLVPSTQSLSGLQTFTVQVYINTNGSKQIRGWQANINFDASKVQCTGYSAGSFLEPWAAANGASVSAPTAPVIDNVNGQITGLSYAILGAPDAGGATGNGVLATLTFQTTATANGAAAFSLANLVVIDANSNQIANVNTLPASVTVTLASTNSSGNDVSVDSNLGSQLTFIAPSSISGWNLVVTNANTVLRTLNVFSNTNWQVTVQDTNSATGGYLTQYSSGIYGTTKLSNPLTVGANGGNGMGNTVNMMLGGIIASGTPAGQNSSTGGDMRTVTFTQPVTYTDPVLSSSSTYHIVLTFTASNSSY